MKLVTVSEMKAIESQADANGLTYAQMMENAGLGLAQIVQSLGFEDDGRVILGLVGPGNNGGDALVALTSLAANGWRARAFLVKRRKKDDELIRRFEQAGGELVDDGGDFVNLAAFIESASVVLDGVLGTGIKLPLKADAARVLAAARDALDQLDTRPFVIAVDCPSGVDCDSGAAAPECIPADLTVTMACVKQGLLRFPAYELLGDLQVVDIGLPDDLPALSQITRAAVDEEMVRAMLPPRPLDSHKGTFGTALIASGSVSYTGAAYLAGKAAYRIGAGLVTLAIPAPLHAALAGQFPEATWLTLPHENGFIERAAAILLAQNLGRSTALLVGPGLGMKHTTRDFLEKLLEAKLPPMVLDADGLKLLARIPDWYKKLPAPAVLTPHPGEMSVLTGLEREDIQKDREAVASKYAKEWGHVVVLKGAFTVIAAPDGRIAVIPVATPALARAGTGDVLAGLVVGLRAQGVDAFEAAVAGAWIHAQAGLTSLEVVGSAASVLAGDVLDCVNDVMSELRV
jgi:NAD(P)H-hydrate epimerase